MRNSIVAVLALSMTALAIGCGKEKLNCTDFCNKHNACPGAEQLDCAAACIAADNVNRSSGCSSDWDSMMECAHDHEDEICTQTSSSECTHQSTTYGQCMITYCFNHGDDSDCALLESML